MIQRIIGGALAIVLLTSILPVTALAEEEPGTSSESGICSHGNADSCTACDAIATVQAKIEALPSVEAMLAMDNGGRNVVYNSLMEVTDGWELLPAEDQNLVPNLNSLIALQEAFTQLVAPASSNTVTVDKTNFPDPVFQSYVLSTFDSNGDGFLSYEEYGWVADIRVEQMEIASLTGIEFFPNLKILCCNGNQLTQLDVSQNRALTALWCGSNQLTQLDVSQNPALEELECANNQLMQLDVSNNTALWLLHCGNNQLEALDVSQNPALEQLQCGGNQLVQLDVSNNPLLHSLHCGGNQLTSLDLSKNVHLEEWYDYANSYDIETEFLRFDLGTLPGNFDVSKAGNWNGGSVSGTILTVDDGVTAVSYTYNDSSVFTLTVWENGGKWPNTYSVFYDSNGGSAADMVVRVPKNSKYEVLSEAPPTRAGYQFLGWSEDKNAIEPEYAAGGDNTVKATRDMVLYAVWKAENSYYTLTLDGNDGTLSQQTVRMEAGRDYKITAALYPSRAGYVLAGWSSEPDSTVPTVAANGILTPASDMTLYAVWHQAEETPDSSAEPQNTSNNEPAGAEPTYTKEAYPKVMKVAKKGTQLRDAPDAVNGKVTKTLPKGGEVILSHRLTDTDGNVWYVTADGNYIAGEGLTEVKGKIALVFDANGGIGGPKSSANDPNIKKDPPKAEPTREGYLFKGWAYRENATYPEWIYDDIKKGEEITLKTDTILYAVWAKPNESISVDYLTQDKLNKTTGFPQEESLYPNKIKNEGLCTSCATALMIKRKQIVDGHEGNAFDFTDVRMSLGAYENKGVDHYYNAGVKFEEGTEDDRWRRNFDGFWTQAIGFTNLHSEAVEAQRTTYYTAGKTLGELGKNVEERKNSIIKLLEEHPEGIVVYSQYGGDRGHAIVLTGYDEEIGFYACDSVNVRDAYTEGQASYVKSETQTLLSETWLYSQIRGSLFSNLKNCGLAGCVWYIESVSYPNS